MPSPKNNRYQFNFSQLPDVNKVPEEVRLKLSRQPYFRRLVDMHRMGRPITPEIVEQLARQPGAQGFEIISEKLNGEDIQIMVDIATGERVKENELIRGEHDAQMRVQRDPDTGKRIGLSFANSRGNSQFLKDADPEPLEQDKIYEIPVWRKGFGDTGAAFVKGPDNKWVLRDNKQDPMQEAIAQMINPNYKPTAQPGGSAGAGTPPTDTKQPIAAEKKDEKPAYILKQDSDYDRVPVGAAFITPDGERRIKKAKPEAPSK